MMVHVQKGHVTELLPHYEEHRVRILQQLGQIVDPNCTRMLKNNKFKAMIIKKIGLTQTKSCSQSAETFCLLTKSFWYSFGILFCCLPLTKTDQFLRVHLINSTHFFLDFCNPLVVTVFQRTLQD